MRAESAWVVAVTLTLSACAPSAAKISRKDASAPKDAKEQSDARAATCSKPEPAWFTTCWTDSNAPYADGDLGSIDAAFYRAVTREVVFVRGTKAYVYAFSGRMWKPSIDLAGAAGWTGENAPFKGTNADVDTAFFRAAQDQLTVVRGDTAYEFTYATSAWLAPVSLFQSDAAVGAWEVSNAPYAGGLNLVDVAFHDNTANRTSIVRATTAFVYTWSGSVWQPPFRLDADDTRFWSSTNGPFEQRNFALDAAFFLDAAYAEGQSDARTVVLRGTMAYAFDHKTSTWLPPYAIVD